MYENLNNCFANPIFIKLILGFQFVLKLGNPPGCRSDYDNLLTLILKRQSSTGNHQRNARRILLL